MTFRFVKSALLAVTVMASLTATPVGAAYAGSPVDRFYQQTITWQPCDADGVQQDCTSVTVPIDWDRPRGDTLALRVTRHRATGTSQGSLLLNPGGPGAPGSLFVAQAAKAFGAKLLASYDLVGWDTRGVGESSPLVCPPGAGDELSRIALPGSVRERIRYERVAARWARACRTASGPIFDHVDTISNARDLDVLRAVLGDRKLFYAGFSYGTRIGLFYADLFPRRVGRMVLDATVDPTTDNAGFWRGTSLAAERGFTDYLAGCSARVACPLLDLTPKAARSWVGRLITENAELANTVSALVKLPRDWPALDEVLAAARNGETPPPQPQEPDVVNTAINCMDLPDHRTAAQVMADDRRASRTRPVFGHVFMASTVCPIWPVAPTFRPHRITAPGAAPILVVGTTHDTATPYEWAVSVAGQLRSGRLLTRRATGHVAYSRSPCVTTIVDDYFVDGALPRAGKVCTD